jgi:2-dehydro-3-deoxyphosphogluconate aldolase/(4S)-4-hydroxy-2-oxoglutarate aldolase
MTNHAAMPDRAGWSRLIGGVRFIPVVTIEHVRDAVPLAQALAAGGLGVVEVTLRTPRALDAIAAIAAGAPGVVVGAGTILARSQIGEAVAAGARFLVAPGASSRLADDIAAAPVPAMPGAATVSEAMALMERGFHVLKFFPAEASGGTVFLKHLAPVLPGLSFCPTGGIDMVNRGAYLAQSNVLCVGGAFVAPQAAVAAGDFARVTALAREAGG